ncbi:sensor histidine kinase [Pedobacter sp. UBA4863]|uniref:tetratricopeptide repeat-containing sensor histidine kinase n=1 Tax=Pedobacter sp. UBA4863 TaxID=1947060 RepID=UPI0025DEDF30|nr:sensor histidine kinase [Pedobacter sp. UBA4863]
MKAFIMLVLLSVSVIKINAQSKTDSLEKVLKTTYKNDTTTVNLLKLLCRSYIDLDNRKLEKHAKAMLSISEKIGYLKGKADALNFLGIVKDIDADFPKALTYYNEALMLAKQADAKQTIASIANNLGLIEWKTGNLKKALTYFFDGLKQAEAIKNIKLQANMSSNIGLVFQDLNRHQETLDWQKKALALRMKGPEDHGLASTYTNLANAYSYLKSTEKAIYYQKKAIELQQKLEDEYGLGISYSNLGGEYKILRNYPEALKYYNLSKEMREKNGDKLGLTFTYMSMAIIYKNQHKNKEAITFGEKSLALAKEIKSDERIAENSLGLSEIYEDTGNHEKALALLRQYNNHHDKVFNEDMNKKVSELHIKYKTEEKENQLNKSKLLLIEKENEARNRNLWLFSISGLTLFTIAASLYVYKQQQLKHSLKTEILKIEGENKLHEQRLDISRNLHDNIGSQLTFINSFMDTLKLMSDTKNEAINERINNISSFTRDAIIELRDTVWALNSDTLTFEDLQLRVLNFIDKAQAAKESIQFKFDIDKNASNVKFSSAHGVNLYRTIQEAVNNAIKYSEATAITIQTKAENAGLTISITDNGKGFDPKKEREGNGLYNMQKRIEEIGGQFILSSTIGSGTQIKIILKETSDA